MSDEIDDRMSECLPGLREAVKKGLAAKKGVGSFIHIATPADSPPYRATAVDWVAVQQLADVTQAEPHFDNAYRVSKSLSLTLNDLKELQPQCNARAQRLGSDARASELTAVLALIQAANKTQQQLTSDGIKAARDAIGGTCRLIANGEEAKRAADAGVIAELLAPPSTGMPASLSGLMVRMDNGPRLTRTTNDFTLTWQRGTGEIVILTLSEVFFLDNADESAGLTP